MNPSQFLLLLAAIYIAPHMPSKIASLTGGLFLACALLRMAWVAFKAMLQEQKQSSAPSKCCDHGFLRD